MRRSTKAVSVGAGAAVTLAAIVAVTVIATTAEPEACTITAGGADDLAALADAYDAGTAFCIPEGNYPVSRPIVVEDGDVWQSQGQADPAGADGVRPVIDGQQQAPNVFDATGSNGATIRGLEIKGATGDTACQPACGRGISGGTTLTLDDVRATENANQGVGGPGNGLLVHDSLFDHNGSRQFFADGTFASAAGIKTVNSAKIYDSAATDNAWVGFWCDLECGTFEIHDSVASGNGKGGIFYEVSTGPAIFEGNTIQDNGFGEIKRRNGGLLSTSSQNAEVYGNTLGGNYERVGLRITEDSREPNVKNMFLHDNALNGDTVLGCDMRAVKCQRNR